MTSWGAERIRDEAILIARILLVVLFVIFGWGKLTNYTGTVGYMAQVGAPMPSVAALVAILAEVFAALAVAIGLWTRPLALVLAVYTLGAALIGHPFWTMEAEAHSCPSAVSVTAGFACRPQSASPSCRDVRCYRG